ncbi:hypothetical protein, partial [uncultured Halovibrio sp.]|uniref:hypothetical protein n=1 Tax=uncultured Halovibrio sp. TaxID=985049 RepID=UPI0025F7458A
PGRSDEELHVFCVTLAGIHKKRRKKLERKINDLKKSIAPNSNPDDWSHHFKDIWSSKAAENFSNLGSLNDRINYGLQFSDHLRSLRPHLVTMTCIMAKPLPVEKAERAKSIKMNKEEVFSHSLVSSLEYVRKNKKKIRWIFDKLKDGQNPEGWAKETFLGLQYTRLFTWLSHRAYVPEPEFREPGSDVLSEVADYISFCAAREVFKRAKGDEPELPTARFGKSFYFTIDNNGNAYSKSSVGMPMERLINYT